MAGNWWSDAFANPKFRTALSEMGQDLGYGLANSTNFGNAFGVAARRGAEMQPYRDQMAMQADEKAKQEEMRKRYSETLAGWGGEYAELAQAVAAGGVDPVEAYMTAWERRYKPTEAIKPIEVNGQLVNPMTGEVLGDYRDPQSGFGNAPSGYQWNPDGTQSFIPGGPADPSTQAKTTEAQRRNQQLASVIQPELAAVEQNWAELASGSNQAGGMIPGVGNALTSPGYQQASNSLATIAQSYLYSVSGAAATDAEVRKIVDSVTPKPFESQQSIDAKLARIRQMADAVIQAGGGGQQPAPGGQTSSGLQWSIEP